MKPAPIQSRKTSASIALDDIRDFVIRMQVEADNTMTRCIDRRYTSRHYPGAIAFPGADLGLSVLLMSFGFSSQLAFDVVFDFTRHQCRKYYWHTDPHEGRDGCLIGCGHCQEANCHPSQYRVDGSEIGALINRVHVAQSTSCDLDLLVLQGDHFESGILIIESLTHSVGSWDTETGTQFFVYDRMRYCGLLGDLACFLETRNFPISYMQLYGRSETHMQATLGYLASSRGKPMYSVQFDQGNPKVSCIGCAPICSPATET